MPEAVGSVRRSWDGRVVQLARTFGSHPKGHRFESCHAHHLLLLDHGLAGEFVHPGGLF